MFVMLSRINQRIEITSLHEGVLNSYNSLTIVDQKYLFSSPLLYYNASVNAFSLISYERK